MSGEHRPVPWRYATPRTPGRARYGRAIGTLSAAIGTLPMPWQQHISDVGSEIDPDTGEWAYHTLVVTVQRQAGKTTWTTPFHLHECMRVPDSYCWFTAQTRQAARDTFLKAMKPVMRSKLKPMLKLRRSNGSEGIEILPNGSEFRVFAAGTDELHGKTNRRVTIDEPWSLSDLDGAELMQAVVPTFTTTAGQLVLISTAGTAESVFLWEWVQKGREAVRRGDRTGIAYFECSIPADSDPADLNRPGRPELRDKFIDLVLANHPAHGFTLKKTALYAALSQMSPGEWCRAYGNLWTGSAETVIVSGAFQAALRPPEAPLPEDGHRIAYGFAVGEDGADAAIAAAWRDDDDVRWCAILAAEAGSAWLPARLADLNDRREGVGFGFNDHGPSAVAADRIARAGIPVSGLSGSQYATACAELKTTIETENQEDLRLIDDPALQAAHLAAARRRLGDGWVWDLRNSTATIAPLVAVTVALWTLDHAPAFEVI